MGDPAFWHRLQFGFTIVFHYLFPQITMGVAPFLALWSWRKLRDGEGPHARALRFWARIFGITFGVGVVTGIPMEFQFGTNWAGFSRYAGGVIGQTLAMEGMFAFFLESAMIGALVWGERALGPRNHFLAALGVFLGSWLSGYFILTTNAFMQHPVGHAVAADGTLQIGALSTYLLNPWAIVEFAHTMTAAVVTGAFVIAAVGAFYALRGVHREQSDLYLKWGCTAGLVASILVAFPTGDQQAKMVARHQEVVLAAMEGRFQSGPHAPLTLIGEPDVAERRLQNPIKLPGVLSFLAYGTFHSEVQGLDAFPVQDWPPELVLLYYSFHVMSGLGTLFILLMALAVAVGLRGRLHQTRGILWVLMLAAPFPFIATTAGWMTAELGRQPWLVYGLFRTSEGFSRQVSTGQTIFTLIGFAGIYFVLGLLYLGLVGRDVLHGPEPAAGPAQRAEESRVAETWFAILCLMLTAYVVLDGWDFGAGILHLFVARTEAERQAVFRAIGPLWSWNEVWLIASGGVLFLAFPRVLATGLAGTYLALFLVLWLLIGRGVAIEARGAIADPLWRSFWELVFAASSLLLPVLFGAALGNVVRGFPLDASAEFSLPLFTDFGVRGPVGLLDWYTISIGVFAAIGLAAHGATYLAWRTEGALRARSVQLGRGLWLAAFAVLPEITAATWRVRPELFEAVARRPVAWLGVALVIAGTVALVSGERRGRELLAFLGSCAWLTGLLGTAAAGLFPVMLPSTVAPEYSMTVHGGGTSPHGLAVALVWWPVALLLSIGYFAFVFRKVRGKVSLAEEGSPY